MQGVRTNPQRHIYKNSLHGTILKYECVTQNKCLPLVDFIIPVHIIMRNKSIRNRPPQTNKNQKMCVALHYNEDWDWNMFLFFLYDVLDHVTEAKFTHILEWAHRPSHSSNICSCCVNLKNIWIHIFHVRLPERIILSWHHPFRFTIVMIKDSVHTFNNLIHGYRF